MSYDCSAVPCRDSCPHGRTSTYTILLCDLIKLNCRKIGLNINAILVLTTDEHKPYSKTIAVYCENVYESSRLLIHVHSLTVRGPTIDSEKVVNRRGLILQGHRVTSYLLKATQYYKRLGFDILPILAGKLTVFKTRVKRKIAPTV